MIVLGLQSFGTKFCRKLRLLERDVFLGQILLRISQPEIGRIRFFGQNVETGLRFRQSFRIALLTQQCAAEFHFSDGDILMVGAKLST